MFSIFAAAHLWVVLVSWAVTYSSDYYLSIFASRLYQSGVDQVISYEGGIELTPQFRDDVAQARIFSPRWLRALFLVEAILVILWFLAVRMMGQPLLFGIPVAGLFLVEAAIHSRHLRVLALYWRITRGQGPDGRIEYPHWLSLEQSALEFLAFALIFALVSILTGDLSILGGTLTCGAVSFRHWQWGRRALGFWAGVNSRLTHRGDCSYASLYQGARSD